MLISETPLSALDVQTTNGGTQAFLTRVLIDLCEVIKIQRIIGNCEALHLSALTTSVVP